ncbi:MAG: hypothetical protein GX097_07835, partial [Methanomicrobiales archaeon]|nr:hypothetical protein [Methanomicrobiales archaeon]
MVLMVMIPMPGGISGKKPSSSSVLSHLNGKIILVAICAMLFALTGVASAGSIGDGSADDPFQISNSDRLIELSMESVLWDKHFILMNDIVIPEGTLMNPIGNETKKFTGTFDGKDFTISGFTIVAPSSAYIGLFGYLDGSGKIKNVKVVAGDAGVLGTHRVGILVGENEGEITHCSATGS